MTDEQQLDVQGFGLRARVRGHDIIVVILIVVMFLGVGYTIFEHDRKNALTNETLAASQLKVIEELSALTYVMTLTSEERARLNLSMPDSLRKKLRQERPR